MSTAFESEVDAPELGQLSSLAQFMVYRVPGCSDTFLRLALQESYRDFCLKSCCLVGKRVIRLLKDVYEYATPPEFGGVVDCVSSVRMRHRVLRQGIDYDVVPVGGCTIIIKNRMLVPVEDEEEPTLISVETVEIPKLGSEKVPRFILDRWGEAICSGALFRMMSQTGKAWSDSEQARQELVKYDNACSECKSRMMSGGHQFNGTVDSYDPSGIL